MTLRLDEMLDLGRDSERVSSWDAERQRATVDKILGAFLAPEAERREVQMLADEVGLGKTYVALATAYTLLRALRKGEPEVGRQFSRCYRAVLVLTPAGNHALARKWEKEVSALVKRCARDGQKAEWFRSKACATADELLQALVRADDLRRRREPVVLIAESNLFQKRLADPALRFIAACLFRWWGNMLTMRQRYHLVRGLASTHGSGAWEDAARWEGRGEYEVELWDWSRHERFLESPTEEQDGWPDRREWLLFSSVSLTYRDVERALDGLASTPESDNYRQIQELLQQCRDVPLKRPSDRRTTEYAVWARFFGAMKDGLRDVYRSLWPYLLRKTFPLVIVDEAHHFRSEHRKDRQGFTRYIAPFTCRVLLLTATPFQLHRDELLRVLASTDALEQSLGAHRSQALRQQRQHLEEAMGTAQERGRELSRSWGALSDLHRPLESRRPEVMAGLQEDPRTKELALHWNQLRRLSARQRTEALERVPGSLRPFFRRALDFMDACRKLEAAMRPFVIRHRRDTLHRRYWVGREYPAAGREYNLRPDQNRLHPAPGSAVPQESELAQYLLMKVVAERSQGKRRTALGSALTGCYTTLWLSKEGRQALDSLERAQVGLLPVLQELTGYAEGLDSSRDAEHPKMKAVVGEVVRRWEQGEKSLVFCFRQPTARRLHALVHEEIARRLHATREELFKARGSQDTSGGQRSEAMSQFRRSLTARDGSGVPLFLDRLLLGWLEVLAAGQGTFEGSALEEQDLERLAQLCARARRGSRWVFSDFRRPDRVFLHRALEHVLALRLAEQNVGAGLKGIQGRQHELLLRDMCDERWVRFRYGLDAEPADDVGEGHETTEHGARTSLATRYVLANSFEPDILQAARSFLRARRGGNVGVLDTLLSGPSLFVPRQAEIDVGALERTARMRSLLFRIAWDELQERWDWSERARVLDAVGRALLREDILLRMPREVFAGGDERWATSLLRGFHQAPGDGSHLEPLAARVHAFLQELADKSREERQADIEYALRTNAEAVVLVTGETRQRDTFFSGFNTPLLPDVLICTQVGQEGIDLHRQCRHVIHYDLGWNPATIEQRTGRVDRIGSKAARERELARSIQPVAALAEAKLPGLDIALPYLSGTYDERIFQRLLARAQAFDLLTGGHLTADRQEDEVSWQDPDDEGQQDALELVTLPVQMLEDLRVDLSVVEQQRHEVAHNDEM